MLHTALACWRASGPCVCCQALTAALLLFLPPAQAKGKGKKGERDTKPKDRAQKLLHTFETLNTFMKMGIEVPQTTAEVPKVGGAAAAAGRQAGRRERCCCSGLQACHCSAELAAGYLLQCPATCRCLCATLTPCCIPRPVSPPAFQPPAPLHHCCLIHPAPVPSPSPSGPGGRQGQEGALQAPAGGGQEEPAQGQGRCCCCC